MNPAPTVLARDGRAMAVHEFACPIGSVLESRHAFLAILRRGTANVLESEVRDGPDDGSETHPGALRVELLHRAGQSAAAGGREPYPVADNEQDLSILRADRAGAACSGSQSETKRDDGSRIDITWPIENASWMFGRAGAP